MDAHARGTHAPVTPRDHLPPHRRLAALLRAGALLAGCASAAARPAASRAQTAPDVAVASPPAPICFRGRPLARCETFLLYELALHGAVASTATRSRFPDGYVLTTRAVPTQLSLAIGGMRNRDRRTAVGGAFLLGIGVGGDGSENAARTFGAVGRWRRWHGANRSVELGAGPALIRLPLPPGVSRGGREYVGAAGLVAEARANAGDLLAASARLTVVPSAEGRPRAGLGVGGSLGSSAAVTGTVVLGAIFVFLVQALAGG